MWDKKTKRAAKKVCHCHASAHTGVAIRSILTAIETLFTQKYVIQNRTRTFLAAQKLRYRIS